MRCSHEDQATALYDEGRDLDNFNFEYDELQENLREQV